MHNRTSIRDALAAVLADVPFPVFVERRHRISSDDRPCGILTLGEDAVEGTQRAMASGQTAYKVEHNQACTIELHADGVVAEEVMEALDAMELELERALASDITLGDLCEMIEPVGSELEASVDQDRVIAVRVCNYLIPWRAEFGAPDTPET